MSLGYHIGDFYDARGPETSKKNYKISFRLNWCLLKDCRPCFRFVNFVLLLIIVSLCMFALISCLIKTGIVKMYGIGFLIIFF